MNSTSKGFRTYDPAEDTNVDVAQWIKDDSTYNMSLANELFVEQDEKMERLGLDYKASDLKIEEKLDNKSTLNGKVQQNFNFIENEVVQDGLIEHGIGTTKNVIAEVKSMLFKINLDTSSPLKIVGFNGSETQSIITAKKSATSYTLVEGSSFDKELIRYSLEINKDYWVYIEFDLLKTNTFIYDANMALLTSKTTSHINYDITAISLTRRLLYYILYNQSLAPQEIQHNFSVLNNSPSIKELHTTDATGKTSISCFGSDENHVEMSTGRTLRDEYMGVLKTMGKEFVSSDGSPTEVNNGIEARVISGEVKGQTVKTFCKVACDLKPSWGASDVHFDKHANTFEMTRNEDMQLESEFYGEKGKTYTIIANVISNNATTIARLVTGGVNEVTTGHLNINPGQVGLVKYKFTANVGDTTGKIKTYKPKTTAGLFKLQGYVLLEGDWTSKSDKELLDICSNFKSGLNSTQAIISNNGQLYPIYESTIQGQTRILNAQGVEVEAGTAGARLVSLEPTDSSLPKLGSVPNVSDVVDRASKVAKLNTKERTMVDATVTLVGTQAKTTRFRISLGENTVASSGVVTTVNNIFKDINIATLANDEEGLTMYSSSNIDVKVLTSRASTVEQFKSLIANLVVRYQLATPQEIQLTEKQLSAYDTYKKLISLGGVDDVKDTLEIKEDGSGVKVSSFNKYKLTGSENIELDTTYPPTDTNYLRFRITTPFTLVTNPKGQCSVTSWIDVISTSVNKFSFGGATTSRNLVHCIIEKDKLKSQDSAGMAEWLRNNNIEIEAQVTPLVTTIPKEVMPTILTRNQTNILSVGDGVNASSFKVTLPTTGDVAKEYSLSPINRWMTDGTTKAELLKNGDIRLVLELTAPSEFSTILCLLPKELRPKAERTVLGYNGNTPVVVKIGTDGSVKLPVSATGTIKLNDTYEL